MLRIPALSALLASALLVCAPSAAAEITKVSPEQAALGDEITIAFDGDPGPGKPKVFLTAAGDTSSKPKAYKLKVLQVVADGDLVTITAQVKKGLAGAMDLTVQPKGKGVTPTTLPEALTLMAPQLGAPELEGDPKSQQFLPATFVGNGKPKPKLTAGGKKAKVVAVGAAPGDGSNTGITFVVPPSLANGAWDVEVSTKLGTTVAAGAMTVVNSTKKIGKDLLTATVDGSTFKAKGKFLGGCDAGGAFQMLGTNGKTTSRSLSVSTLSAQPGTYTVLDLAAVTYTEVSLNPFSTKIWQAGAAPLTVTIQANSGGQVAGTVSGTLVPGIGGTGNKTVEAEFIITVQGGNCP